MLKSLVNRNQITINFKIILYLYIYYNRNIKCMHTFINNINIIYK